MMESRECVMKTVELTKQYKGSNVLAVDHVSFELFRGELLGLLGESGCGKSTLASMLMHLLPPTSGQILFHGEEIQSMPESVFRRKRSQIQMIYQNPFDCLDPSMRIKRTLEEPLRVWFPHLSDGERLHEIKNILSECELPENCLDKYPSEFSGGQLQRIAIARALLANPQVLIADEIISALDVSVQSQVLDLLLRLKNQHHLTILFITHDLSVAQKVSDRVMVMQSGQIKGIGTPREVFSDSADPYIQKLKSAVFSFVVNR